MKRISHTTAVIAVIVLAISAGVVSATHSGLAVGSQYTTTQDFNNAQTLEGVITHDGDVIHEQYNSFEVKPLTETGSYDTGVGSVRGFRISPDGTHAYNFGFGDTVYQYKLSTPYDIESASLETTYDTSSQTSYGYGLDFADNGSMMYVTDDTGDDINQYELSTPWDVSTATYTGNFAIPGRPQSPEFSEDGTRMYMPTTDGDEVKTYSLSTPFDVTTASEITSESLSTSGYPRDIQMAQNGHLAFVRHGGTGLSKYKLSTPYDLSTAQLVETNSDFGGWAFDITPDGETVYLGGTTVTQYRVGQIPDRPGRYVSPNRTVSNAREASINLTLANATATGSVQEWTGDSWNTLASTTWSTTGNHSLDLGTPENSKLRTVIEFSNQTGETTAVLHDESILVETKAPAIDNSSLAPNTTSSTVDATPVTLSADISDPDFSKSYGDSATVEWFVDGSKRGETTISSNGTTSYQLSLVTAGNHDWHVEVTDSYGHTTTSSTASFSVASKLYIYNESSPTELVDNATVEVRMYLNETGSPSVYERNTSDGVVNMSGLPANKPFVVVADADNYTSRRIFVPSLYETQNIYLLPDSATTADTIFSINDYTGNYPSDSTVLLVQRSLNGSYQTVLGDYFGAAGEFPAQLAYNKRHRLVLYNVETGEKRTLGTYTPLTAQTQTVTVAPSGEIKSIETAPTADVRPGLGVLPALNDTTLEFALRNNSMEVSSWRIVATNSTSTLWNASVASGTLNVSHDFALASHGSETISVRVFAETPNGTLEVADKTYRIQESLDNDTTLLATLGRLAGMAAPGTGGGFTTFVAVIITIFGMVGVASTTPASGEVVGVTGVLTLVGFSAIGWVGYDLVFVSGVGVVAFGALRRGL